MNPVFRLKVDRGRVLETRGYQKYIQSLKTGYYDFVVRKPKKNRTLRQNRYYWGVVVKVLADHFGYTIDEMHEALKWKFLQKKDAPLPTVKSTTELSTVEFTDYLESVWRWAATEYSVYIPDPDKVDI